MMIWFYVAIIIINVMIVILNCCEFVYDEMEQITLSNLGLYEFRMKTNMMEVRNKIETQIDNIKTNQIEMMNKQIEMMNKQIEEIKNNQNELKQKIEESKK